MQTQPARLTDCVALRRNRSRALRSEPALFAHAEAMAGIKERLSAVNRAFNEPVIVSGFSDIWQNAIPSAKTVSDKEILGLSPGAHDLVVSGLVMHWANDPVGHLVQCRRALKPDGLFLGVGFGGQTLNELRVALTTAESNLRGGLSPRVAPMGEIRDLGALLQRAGFAMPVADSFALSARYRDMWHLMRDLRAMGETNALNGRSRRFSRRDVMAAAADTYAQYFSDDQGRIKATFDLITLTGWAPSPEQPQPLRPGSATTRLADALGTDESRLAERGED